MGNSLRFRVTQNEDHKPKQEGKSYYKKQKKYPDLHRRRTLHPRDLSDFVAWRDPAPAPAKLHWHAYARSVRLL